MANVITVMVIDDEIHMRRLIGRMLNSVGFEVIQAASGSEALQLLEDGQKKPDVITCDISMPDMNGFEILAVLRNNAEWATIPIIMLTAMGQLSDADKAREMGANAYITKPFSVLSLINMIRQQTAQVADVNV
ncbi:MAG: response regulator [Chloroflexota bacterium]